MRKATNIEHVLCDMKDLCQSVATGNDTITGVWFDENDDLIVRTSQKGIVTLWTIGVDDPNAYPVDRAPMKPYIVRITEKFTREVIVWAQSATEVEEIASELFADGEISIDDYSCGVEFECVGRCNPGCFRGLEQYNMPNQEETKND